MSNCSTRSMRFRIKGVLRSRPLWRNCSASRRKSNERYCTYLWLFTLRPEVFGRRSTPTWSVRSLSMRSYLPLCEKRPAKESASQKTPVLGSLPPPVRRTVLCLWLLALKLSLGSYSFTTSEEDTWSVQWRYSYLPLFNQKKDVLWRGIRKQLVSWWNVDFERAVRFRVLVLHVQAVQL